MVFGSVLIARSRGGCEPVAVCNGFVMRYGGPLFPARRSNQITYEAFCLWGGLANDRLQRIERRNGSYVYFTYHDCSTL